MKTGRVTILWAAAMVFLTLPPGTGSSMTVAGVDIPDRVTLSAEGPELVLNGAGIRTKLFIKVYVGALYLAEKEADPARILASNGPTRVTMHFLHSKVSREKIVDAWSEGFARNLSSDEQRAVQSRLERFNSFFGTMVRGDVIHLDYLPASGTVVWINTEKKGTVEGEDFYRALLGVWLGEHPADGRLKKAMLSAPE